LVIVFTDNSQVVSTTKFNALLEKLPVVQLFKNFLQNPKIYYHVHKSTSLVPTLSQMNPVHTNPSYFPKIQFICLPSGFFPSGFSTKTFYAFFVVPMSTTCSAHLILLHLIILIILGEEYK
jgi:hypothetical protein